MGKKLSKQDEPAPKPAPNPRTLGDPDAKGTLCNDLQVAIDVNVGQGWCALYPNDRLRFQAGLVQVRLRDDHDIQGQGSLEGEPANWDVSASFGPFCSKALGFLEREAWSTQREEKLRKQRQKVVDEKQMEIIHGAQTSTSFGLVGCCFGPLALLLVCTIVQPENELASLLLSLAVFALFGVKRWSCCTGTVWPRHGKTRKSLKSGKRSGGGLNVDLWLYSASWLLSLSFLFWRW